MEPVGLGTYQLKGDVCYNTILTALRLGYRLFDTAILYKNQKDVGRAINDSGIDRSEIFITSKVHFKYIESGTVVEAIKVILDELDLNYVDLLLLHKPDAAHNVLNWNDMIQIQKLGGARRIGTSNFLISDLDQIINATGITPFVNQIEFNPLCQRIGLVEYCKKQSIHVQAYRSFALGKCIQHAAIIEVAKRLGLTPAQIVLLWTRLKGVYVIPMSKEIAEIQENIKIKDLSHISPNELEELDRLNENYYTMPKYADP